MSILDKPCLASRRAFSDHMDGLPLSPWRRVTVYMHKTFCPLCRPIWTSLNATRDALGALRDEDVPPMDPEKR